jgi:hypothetical protein
MGQHLAPLHQQASTGPAPLAPQRQQQARQLQWPQRQLQGMHQGRTQRRGRQQQQLPTVCKAQRQLLVHHLAVLKA